MCIFETETRKMCIFETETRKMCIFETETRKMVETESLADLCKVMSKTLYEGSALRTDTVTLSVIPNPLLKFL